MTPALLRRIGEALYGAEWQRALARGLGPLHPEGAREAIDDSLVRKWTRGARPVPDWVAPAALRLINSAEADLATWRERIAAQRAEFAALRQELGQ